MSRKIAFCLLPLMLLLLSNLRAAEEEKQPLRAMIYSAVLPGGGQIYNEAYIKAGAVIGVQAYLIGRAFYLDDKAKHYGNLMDEFAADPYYSQLYQTKRDQYRDDLRSDYWWIGVTVALSVADAFVDAHLSNYNSEKEKVRLKFEDKLLQLELKF
ncbi:MAG TPA: DUF5683 domain-containing protein [Candidatus Cloacimonadota bacterium]|nr:DUF5683 domain-containing protein [Candidatus Cloacimonadota bacterium]